MFNYPTVQQINEAWQETAHYARAVAERDAHAQEINKLLVERRLQNVK